MSRKFFMELFRLLAFFFGQMMFVPAFIIATGKITKKKLNILDVILYLLLSPFLVYIYASILIPFVLQVLPEKATLFVDLYVFVVSALFLGLYVLRAGKYANKTILTYIYATFYLIQISFVYDFESLAFTIISHIVCPILVNVVLFILIIWNMDAIAGKQPLSASNKENKIMLFLPLTAIAINLFQTVTYAVVRSLNVFSEENLVALSMYSMVINTLVLILEVIFTYLIFRNFVHQRKLLEDKEKIRKMSTQSLRVLIKTLEARDPYTNGHSIRVAKYSRMIANEMGFDKEYSDQIYSMALMHDVGKIGVSDVIINKNGELTKEEYDVIKTHPGIGASILREIDYSDELLDVVLHHHERVDGKGYPDGLCGDQISMRTAIVSVADAYDAMTSMRSYRELLPQDHVIQEIKNNMNTQFKKEPAEAMLRIIEADTYYELRQE